MEQKEKQFYKSLDIESERILKWLSKQETPIFSLEDFIFWLIIDSNLNYYEVIGLMEEIKQRFREVSLGEE